MAMQLGLTDLAKNAVKLIARRKRMSAVPAIADVLDRLSARPAAKHAVTMFVPETPKQVEEQLLGPGGMFETVPGEVLGERMNVFKNRARSLRDFLTASARLGEAEHLVFSDGSTERRFTFAEHARRVARMASVLERRYGVIWEERRWSTGQFGFAHLRVAGAGQGEA